MSSSRAALQAASLVALAGAGAAVRFVSSRRERGELRACARLLEVLLCCDLASLALARAVLDPAREAGRLPYAGFERACFHASQALFLAWPIGVASLAWLAFSPTFRREAFAVGAVACASVTALCALQYPELRGATLLGFYRVFSALCAVSGLIAIVEGSDHRSLLGERVGRAHLASLLLLAGLAAELAGPFLGDASSLWWLAQATWIAILAAVALAAAWRPPWGKALPG